ncbi:response regulator [Mucilaginibacter sp. CAU 1740]|uniref:response regulator n=1 Tax=Mucilaginibacter sp. CAU 1740 TaxID=3140365 RepID=UPI00325A9B80
MQEMTAEKNPVNTWIVDDDDIYVYGLKKLADIKGVNTTMSHFINGQEAINELKNTNDHTQLPDVILLDINMPVMDGWEFMNDFAEIKSRLGKIITIYFVSSSISLDDIYRAKSFSEVTDYIFKPVTSRQLNQIYNNSPSPTDGKIYRYGA